MKTGIAVSFVILLAFTMTAAAQENSPMDPAAIGTPVKSLIELGSVYPSNYDIAITVLETIRGKEALDLLKKGNATVKQPKDGFEYMLARVKFEMTGREISENKTFELGTSPLQWVAYSSNIEEYESVSVAPPKPVLTGVVRSGNAVEGWLTFAVEQKESKPVMAFDPDSGGANGRGKTLFFKLYQ